MLNLGKFHSTFIKVQKIGALGPSFLMSGWRNFTSMSNQIIRSSISQSSEQRATDKDVAIFWDLDNKPPKSFPPYDAALKLKKAALKFGFVKYMIAYANPHAFSYVPPSVRAQRRERAELNEMENIGVVKADEPYVCGVCGRRFYYYQKFMNHFKQIHEREHMKRLNHIVSARGKRRLNLVARYAVKMEKYRNAARSILTPEVGYGLGDELKRAGFWVKVVSDKPQAADVALRNHMVDMMDRRMTECLVLVSDDSGFVGILKEAKLRCLKTVVVGDVNEGVLKRTADVAFSWQEIMRGKAKSEAISVVKKWKDQDVLQKLEWSYDPEKEKKLCFDEVGSEGSDIEDFNPEECGPLLGKDDVGAWWELESRIDDVRRPQE